MTVRYSTNWMVGREMNERIRQLAEQAGQGEPFHIPPEFVEKFAELIVEECARRAEAYAYMSPNFITLAEELRKMNGIE